MIKPAEEQSLSSTNTDLKAKYKTKFPITFSLLLFALTLGFILLIVYYFNYQKDAITTDIKKDLAVISEFKVKQITNWRNERLLDGYFITENNVMINVLKSISRNKSDLNLKNNIGNWLKILCINHKYNSARIVDSSGSMISSYPDSTIKLGYNGLRHLKKANDSGKPFLSDFHIYENTNMIHLDLVVPIKSEDEERSNEFLVLEIDPNEYIYPMIQAWPSESKTAETLLIEKIGGEVVYLNELRHSKNSALRLKIDTIKNEVPAIKAVKGVKGITEGTDYRGTPVLAYIEPVPGTNWFMIAKIDKDEIYEDINKSTLWVAILIIVVIIIAIIVVVLYWSRQKEKYFKTLLDSDRKRLALISHFDYIIKNANDVFLLYDENAKVIEVNEKALSVYGYTKDEFLDLNLNDLRAPGFRSDISDTIRYVKNHPDGLVFETTHIKKDGTIFPIESSTRYLQIGDKIVFQSVVRDITERKQAERALSESEQKFSTAFRLSPEAVILVSAKDGKYVDVNETFLRDLNYTRDEVIGKTSEELDVFYDYNDRVQLIKDVNEFGFVYGREYRIKTKSEKILTCLISTVNVTIGDTRYYISSVLNITQRKEAEERIEYLNRIYAFLSQVNQAIVRIDNREELFDIICSIAIEFGKFRFAWIGLTDVKNNKVLPISFGGIENGYLDIVKESIGNNINTNPYLIKLLREGVNIISNDICNDGFYKYDRDDAIKNGYKSSGIFPLRENNKIIGILCLYSDKINCFNEEEVRLMDEVSMDIAFALDYYVKESHRKEINEALSKSELKFRTLFDNASDAILLIDDYRFIEFNKVAEQIFGLERNTLLLKSPFELSPEFQPDGTTSEEKAREYIDAAFQGKITRFEWLHKRADGTSFETEITLNSVYIGSKKMLLVVISDISERKRYEEGLKASIEKAEEMNRVKSNFLANMSHELRTPMTGILGFADILSKTLSDPEQKEMAEVIYRGGTRLTNTLNMILDLSKIEAEKIEVDSKPAVLSEIIIESVKLFEAAAEDKSLTLKSNIKDELTAIVDEKLLIQVLSNLIKNSITYTKKGNITVELSGTCKEKIEYAEIKVTDTGIGIPSDSIELIFEPFRQVSEGWTRTFEGTGLGLTISKKYVELMNGTIYVESEINKGTTFTILFKTTNPCLNNNEINNNIKGKKLESAPKSSKKILLVEDDEFTVYTIKKVLERVCIFDTTNNGFDAIDKTKKIKYDIILMDIGLKGMDGLETTKEIRKLPGYENIPIVALTAFAMEGDKEKFIEGGCSHYLSKPFSNEKLKKLITEI
jgi:PAS domain S-box-containing protein